MIQYFIPDESDFCEVRSLVSSFSPIDYIICPRKPFGEVSAEEYFQYASETFNVRNVSYIHAQIYIFCASR